VAKRKKEPSAIVAKDAHAISIDEDARTARLRFIRDKGDVLIDFPLDQIGWLISELANAQSVAQGRGPLAQTPMIPRNTSLGVTMSGLIFLRFEMQNGSAFAFALERDEMRKVLDGAKQVLAQTATEGPGTVQ